MFESSFVQKAERSRKASYWFMKVMLGLSGLTITYLIYDDWQGSQVMSRKPIGTVVGMTGEGRKTLVETENGYYPLIKSLVVEKGTPLVLEIRGNGDRYVCNAAGTVCSGTSKRGFEIKQGPTAR